MHRNKKIILLSHCILNVNSKVDGIANYKGSLEELVSPLIKKGYGFIQLPCPEVLHCGVKRWGVVKEQLETPYFKDHCESILQPIINQIIDYKNNAYEIVACIGIDKSPSCGVSLSCRGSSWGKEIDNRFSLDDTLKSLKIVEEKGVFIEVFKELLSRNSIQLNFLAIDESNPKSSVENILKELK